MPNHPFSIHSRTLGGVLIAVALSTVHAAAAAWGADGHCLVAELAEAQLTPQAAAGLNRLLALEQGATLASISTWADDFRSPTTAARHYVNFGRDTNCLYDVAPICIQGNWVVGAIDRQLGVLASNAADEQRLKALKCVVHFIADVHQPLHAGYADNRGDNNHQLHAFGKGSNMRALWDSALIQNWHAGPDALRAAAQSGAAGGDRNLDEPKTWAEESCRVVATESFRPEGRQIREAYVQRWASAVSNRLGVAAHRLADALDRAHRGW